MTSGVERILNTRVKRRCCPGCGFLIDQALVERSRYDILCQRCGKYTIDQFQIVEWEQKRGGDSA